MTWTSLEEYWQRRVPRAKRLPRLTGRKGNHGHMNQAEEPQREWIGQPPFTRAPAHGNEHQQNDLHRHQAAMERPET